MCPTPSPTTTLEDIQARDVLLCGVTSGVQGLSMFNGDTYEGFEADLVSWATLLLSTWYRAFATRSFCAFLTNGLELLLSVAP